LADWQPDLNEDFGPQFVAGQGMHGVNPCYLVSDKLIAKIRLVKIMY